MVVNGTLQKLLPPLQTPPPRPQPLRPLLLPPLHAHLGSLHHPLPPGKPRQIRPLPRHKPPLRPPAPPPRPKVGILPLQQPSWRPPPLRSILPSENHLPRPPPFILQVRGVGRSRLKTTRCPRELNSPAGLARGENTCQTRHQCKRPPRMGEHHRP